MAIKLKNNLEFLHIPKTGGSWVTEILNSNHLIDSIDTHKHADYDYNLFSEHLALSGRHHLYLALNKFKKKYFQNNTYKKNPKRFCFVRHPLSWYESWWRYMETRGWHNWGEINSSYNWHPNSILNSLGSNDFNEFVWNVVKKRPGYVSELFFSYTKPGISYIGKTENIRKDLYTILKTENIKVDKSSIFFSKEVNASKTQKSLVEWDPKLKKTLTKLELPALVHYGYLNELEQKKVGIQKYIPPNKNLVNIL